MLAVLGQLTRPSELEATSKLFNTAKGVITQSDFEAWWFGN